MTATGAADSPENVAAGESEVAWTPAGMAATASTGFLADVGLLLLALGCLRADSRPWLLFLPEGGRSSAAAVALATTTLTLT